MRWHFRPEHGSELHDLRAIHSASSAIDDRAEPVIRAKSGQEPGDTR
jgi:hypothetical protein